MQSQNKKKILITLKIVIVIFFVEAIIMFILWHLPLELSLTAEVFFDSLLLAVISAPVIYLWIIKPFIDARSRAENALLQSHQELEIRVHERTQNLVKMTSEVKRIYFEKTELLSQISHELRTPLNGILGFAQILSSDSSLQPQQKEHIQLIFSSGRHLLALINDVLNLSRVESGRIDLTADKVNCVYLTKECVMMIESSAIKKNIKIHENYPEESVNTNIYCDATRLKEVVLNLLSNAVKYNRNGGEVFVSVKINHGKKLEIIVDDTGEGIAEEMNDQLFKPFSRLGKEFDNIEGTGIGLALSKRIVELMNGRIFYQKREEPGSRFWVEFDLYKDDLKLESEKLEESEAKKNKKNILIIEIRPSVIRLLEHYILKHDQYKPISAMESLYGMQLAKNKHPSMIFLDVDMPDMSSSEFLRELSFHEETQSIPIVAMGLRSDADYIQEIMNLGFSDYIVKPLRSEQVFELLNRHAFEPSINS